MPDVRETISGRDPEPMVAHGRTTPASMGGARPVVLPDVARNPRGFDAAEAAARRILADRMTRVLPLAGSALSDGTRAIIDCGGPAQGFVWDVKMIHVGPRDYLSLPYPTGITVVAFVRAGTQGSTGGILTGDTSAGSVLSYTQAYPAQAFFGRHEGTVQAGERLQVVVLGLANGVLATVGGQAEQTAADVGAIASL